MSSTEVENKKPTLTLQSSDGEEFVIDEAAALQSQTIKHMVEDGCADNAIPLPNVTSNILARVIEYLNKHLVEDNLKESKNDENNKDDLKKFDQDFVKDVEKDVLFELILAANYLNIKELLDLTSQAVADKIKDMPVEEVRTYFNIINDFTPQEEEDVRKEHAWAHE